MRRNIKMLAAYEGTSYNGWQKQGNTEKTIQGKLEAALKNITGEEIELHGSGRTDSGVHSSGQVCNFHTRSDMDLYEMKKDLNKKLPEDISVLQMEEAAPGFHARLSAESKIYSYTIWNEETHNVFERNYVYQIKDYLNIKEMEKAAGYLIGEKDFRSFSSEKDLNKQTTRNLYSIKINKNSSKIKICYMGNGFLYNMVRIMTGTLIEVGLGKRKPEEILKIFEEKNREAAGFTAPSKGLCLEKVNYKGPAQRS